MEEIERLGIALFNQIHQQVLFRSDFLRDSMIEEAITSAIYEGAHTTRAEAQQLIASGKAATNKDEWMLLNNLRAMKWVHENRDKTLSKEVVLTIHGLVTENTLEGDDANFSGRFRDAPVTIGPHSGIPADLIEPALNEVIALVSKNPRHIPAILKGILLHYFTAYLHPFFDGNGRTARALFYFKSMKNGLDYIQLLSVSAYLKEPGRRYEKAFEKVVANDLDVTYFIDFCLESIHAALGVVQKKVDYLLQIGSLKTGSGLSSNQVGLLQRVALHRFRMISVEEYAQQIEMSREIARQELKDLTARGFLVERTQGKKHVYQVNRKELDQQLKNLQTGPQTTF